MSEDNTVPKWASEMISSFLAGEGIKESKIVSKGRYKLLIGATDCSLFVVEKRPLKPTSLHMVRLPETSRIVVRGPEAVQAAPKRERKTVAPKHEAKAPAPEREVKKPAAGPTPFVHNGYTLYTHEVRLSHNNRLQRIYFFSKRLPKSGEPSVKPDGYLVGVNARTGLPYLKRGREAAAPPVARTKAQKPDDLKLINGIGPEYEKRLNEAGVKTYEDLLNHRPLELEKMAAGGHFGNRPAREKWKEQAKSLINKREKGKL
ncbi:MAG: hypothetical protein CVT48_03510 [Thermoplasmata archaeon HGW-Thermoplasmata-1]|nr:MAG: hypothetical protein CVT48_03510 [Thermoplasmata archaeon HGW-Thermoplasmata-1]